METKIDISDIQPDANWLDFYPDAMEEKCPPNCPKPRGSIIIMTSYTDVNHARNLLTRQSHTGIIHFFNNAPILWYSKRQTTVEASTFRSEFNALRIALDQILAMRQKLRYVEVRVDQPTNVFCDNMSVILNSSKPESTLKRKHNQICFHRLRKAVASKIIRNGYVDSKDNLVDILTKNLSWASRRRLIYKVLW